MAPPARAHPVAPGLTEDGAAVVKAFAERHPDLVLMDLHLPIQDGLAATRAIRALEGSGPRTPILALTADSLPGDREACLAAGMDDYLAKPLRRAVLVDALSRWGQPAEA